MSMLWIVGAVVAVVLVLYWVSHPSLDRLVGKAIAEKNTQTVVEAIGKMSQSAQPSAYNHVIRSLWNNYERTLATTLIRELASNHSTSHIAQYWLKQVMSVEPALAKQELGQEFLDTHYRPEVAAKCGAVG